jgi:uncharacterized membrane protein
MNIIKPLIIALVVFFILDMIWLGWIAKSLYVKHYEPWLRLQDGSLQPLWWAGLIVYLLFAIAIIAFVLPLANQSLLLALLYGGLLGFVTYGVYDFTCLAVFKHMPVGMAFVDWAWGTVLCALTSFATLFFTRL